MAGSFGDLTHSFDLKSISRADLPRYSLRPRCHAAPSSSSSAAEIPSNSICFGAAYCHLQLGWRQSCPHPAISCDSSPTSSNYSGLWLSAVARIGAGSVVIVLLRPWRHPASSCRARSCLLIYWTQRWPTAPPLSLGFHLGAWGCDCYVLPSLMTITSILGAWTASSSGLPLFIK